MKLDPERPEYHRCTIKFQSDKDGNGHFVATSTGAQASHRLLSMRSANALLLVPQGEGTLPVGSVLPALLINKL